MYNRTPHEREDEMKIRKQQYTTDFKKLAVKRVRDGESAGAVAKLGLIEHTLRNGVKAAEAGKRSSCQSGHTGADGTFKTASRERGT